MLSTLSVAPFCNRHHSCMRKANANLMKLGAIFFNIFSSCDEIVYKIQPYQPNLVAQQFGLCQDIPIPMFSQKVDILAGSIVEDADSVYALIELYKERQPMFAPVDFEPKLLCTASFDNWLKRYYTSQDENHWQSTPRPVVVSQFV